VNEYISAHYRRSGYFQGNHIEQQFYDGRVLQSHYDDEREMLNDNGMAIIPSPLTDEIEWTKVETIRSGYIPHLELLLHNIFPDGMMYYCLWNPMMRGESYSISRPTEDETPTANIASMVHIDTDVGAFDLKDFLDIVENNSVYKSTSLGPSNEFRRLAENAIRSKKRFVILNFWRNVGCEPVSSAPLALLSTHYEKNLAFPDIPPPSNSQWYIFPNATRDEVIVFYQYDRNVMQTSDLFHCAICTKDDNLRERGTSFDIRALIVLNEDVPEELDRYRDGRTRPVLSFEESGCFCDQQAEKKRENNVQ
jgi:hypothetical protein